MVAGGGGLLFRGGGGAMREANIFSGLGQQSKNTPDADVY